MHLFWNVPAWKSPQLFSLKNVTMLGCKSIIMSLECYSHGDMILFSPHNKKIVFIPCIPNQTQIVFTYISNSQPQKPPLWVFFWEWLCTGSREDKLDERTPVLRLTNVPRGCVALVCVGVACATKYYFVCCSLLTSQGGKYTFIAFADRNWLGKGIII